MNVKTIRPSGYISSHCNYLLSLIMMMTLVSGVVFANPAQEPSHESALRDVLIDKG